MNIDLDNLKKSDLGIMEYIFLQMVYEEVDTEEYNFCDTFLPYHLQEKGYIKILEDSIEPRQKLIDLFESKKKDAIDEVILYLNEKADKDYKLKTTSNRKFVQGRLDDGYNVEQLKKVIDVMVSKWKNTNMDDYLRPETLFNSTKFQTYINMARSFHKEDWSIKKV